jgi:DnaJ-class molecular chaperone
MKPLGKSVERCGYCGGAGEVNLDGWGVNSWAANQTCPACDGEGFLICDDPEAKSP